MSTTLGIHRHPQTKDAIDLEPLGQQSYASSSNVSLTVSRDVGLVLLEPCVLRSIF